MDNKSDESAGKKDESPRDGGLFTGKLKWWQVLLGFVLVAYLVYGKYQETAAQGGSPPAAAVKK